MNKKILVFIPCYNCEQQIPRVIAQFSSDILSVVSKVIIVNNRSTDDTENMALKAIKKKDEESKYFEVLRNNSNYGLGGSHKVAFNYAKKYGYKYIVILHGDDQGAIKDLIPYLKSKTHHHFDALLGARFHPLSKLPGYSRVRIFGNKIFNLLFSIALQEKVYDLGSGLNCYKVDVLKENFYDTFPDDLTFNYCMIMAHSAHKHKIQFFPITWREEDQISNVKLASQAKRVLHMLFKYIIFRKSFLASEIREMPIEIYSAKTIEL